MTDFKEFYDEEGGGTNGLLLEDYDAIFDRMLTFMEDLDDEQLTDDQIVEYVEIIESLAGPEDLIEAKEKVNKFERELVSDALFVAGLDKFADEVKKKGTITYKSGDKEDLADAFSDYADGHMLDDDDDMVIRDWENVFRESEMTEAPPAKKVRRDPVKRRKAAREHRKVRAKKKLQGKRIRKTAKFKRFKKKQKRMGKRGKTATGKRKRTFIN